MLSRVFEKVTAVAPLRKQHLILTQWKQAAQISSVISVDTMDLQGLLACLQVYKLPYQALTKCQRWVGAKVPLSRIANVPVAVGQTDVGMFGDSEPARGLLSLS